MLVNQFKYYSKRSLQTAVNKYIEKRDAGKEVETSQNKYDDSKWKIQKIETSKDDFTYVNEDINFKRSNAEDSGDFTLDSIIIKPDNREKNELLYNLNINWMRNSYDNQDILICFEYKLKNDTDIDIDIREENASEVIEEELHYLYVYNINNDKWNQLTYGKYTGIFMGDTSDVIALEAQNKMLIYKKNEGGRYKIIRDIDFINEDNNSFTILSNWVISRIQIVDAKRIGMTLYKYNKILKNFEELRHVYFNVFCDFQYPILENISDLVVKASVTDDSCNSKEIYEAIYQNFINDIYTNQSCLQIMSLSYKIKDINTKSSLFWLTSPNHNKPKIFISNLGQTGIFSNEGKLVAVVNEEIKNLYIWDTDVLLSIDSKSKDFRNLTDAQVCKMPIPIEINMDKRKVIMFEKVGNNADHLSLNLQIVILYNDFTLCIWASENSTSDTESEVELIHEMKLPIQQLYSFRFSKDYLIFAGRNMKNKKIVYIYDTFRKIYYKKIPYKNAENILEIAMIDGKNMLFLRDKNNIRKLEYNGKESIKGLIFASKLNSMLILRLSNTGKYLLCKVNLLITKIPKEYFVFVNLEKNECEIIYYKNIKEVYFSENDKYIISITFDNHLLIVELENRNEIKLSFELPNYDTSGHFGQLDYTNTETNGLYCSEDGIINIVKKEKFKIYVLSYNIMENGFESNFKLNFICDINESVGEICLWYFSTTRDNIVFYVENEHNSITYVWNCKRQKIVKVTPFRFSLKEWNLDFSDAYFTNDGSQLILKNYTNDSLLLANEHTSQKYIDGILKLKNQLMISHIKHVIMYDDTYILYTRENTKNKTLSIYHVKIDKIPLVSDKFIIDEDDNAIIFTIPNYMRFGENEKMLVSSNYCKIGFINYGIERDIDNEFRLKSIFWDPISGYYKKLLDYNFIKKMKGEKLDNQDIDHMLNPNLIDRVDENGESLLMLAVKDNNIPIIYRILDWCSTYQYKIRYIKYKDDIMKSDENSDKQHIINIAISKRNRKLLEILSDSIIDNIVYLKDAINVIENCKDELFSDFRDIYLKFVRCVLITKANMKFPGSAFEKEGYIAMTLDSPDKPNWNKKLCNQLKRSDTNDELLLKAIASFNNDYNVDLMDFAENEDDNWEFKIDDTKLEKISKKISKSELVKDFDKKYRVINCESVVYPWTNAANIGQSGLLYQLQRHGLEWQTFDALPIKLMIAHKWKTYGRNKNLRAMLIHAIYLLFFQLYAMYLGNSQMNHEEIILYIYRYIILGVMSIIGFWNLRLEIIQGKKMMFKNSDKITLYGILIFIYNWSYSKWNVFELFLYLSTSTILPSLHIYHDIEFNINNKEKLYYSDKAIYVIASVCCCLIWWKLLYFFQPFRVTGPLILMIFEIIKDIFFFIIVLAMVLIGFTNTFYVLFNNKYVTLNSEIESFSSYKRSLISTFSMMLGEFDIDSFYANSDMQFLSLFLFIVFMLLVLIILINMLIAIMADSFDRIKAKEEISFLIARAQILEDIDSKLLSRQQKHLNEKLNKKFFHILHPKSGISEQNAWLGKVEEISKNVKNILQRQSEALERRLEVQNGSFQEKISDIVDNVSRIETNLRVQIKGEFKNLYEKLKLSPIQSSASSSSSSSSNDN